MEEYNTNYDSEEQRIDTPPYPPQELPQQNQSEGQQKHQPHGWSPYQQPPRKPESSYKGAAIASLVTGICAILFFWYIYLACILAVAGIITSVIYLSKRKDERGLAIAGLVTSIVGVVFSIIFFCIILLSIREYGNSYNRWYNGSDYDDYYDDYYDDDYYDDDDYDDDFL